MRERELFLAALDIEDPAARQAHLQAECADDAALLARVESLLGSHEGQSQFLKTPVVEQIADVSDSVASATIVYENGSTHDDDPDATTFYPHGTAPMTKHQDDAELESVLGYLEPSTKPDSLGRLGHYEVLEVVGRGAFGTVLRAFDEKLHRVVAIKVMAPEMAATSPARKRFLREAQASAAIRHEHVVSVYAVEEKPLPYLVMEFIPGMTLQQRLDERGPLDVPTVLRIGRQIAEGLAAAHAQDLIHRDIKPANILLETDAREMVKVTDFGLARAADDASLTQSGTIAGTPMYMAPEQAQGHKLDQRADLFSFGSVMYQMVSGRPPFRASSTLAVLKRLTEDTPRPIREIIPETPQWLCDIITKLHAKNRDERYQTAREIADVLADCETQLKSHAGLKDFSLIPQAKTQPARWWKWGAVAVVVCPLLALGLYALNRPAVKPEVAENGTIKPPTTDPIMPESDPSSVLPAKQKTPPPAIAPFDAAQARVHQEAWAKHLGVPVEYTNSIGMKFRLIPPGEFEMGSKDPKEGFREHEGHPVHRVKITKAFLIGTHEVTVGEFRAFVTEKQYVSEPERTQRGGYRFAPDGPRQYFDPKTNWKAPSWEANDDLPVTAVSWNDAVAFCQWLGEREKKTYRLPTEAEWEYVCRAGTESPFHLGDSISSDVANMRGNMPYGKGVEGLWRKQPTKVGSFTSNAFGNFDMHGNVWEWCSDWYQADYYRQSPAEDPQGATVPVDQGWGPLYVVRGGGYYSEGTQCRSAYRNMIPRPNGHTDVGFRVVLSGDLPVKTPPPPAIAPFKAAQARAHQEAWAKHLGVPVEYTNSIGMKFMLIPPGEFSMGSTPAEIAAALKVVYPTATHWHECIRSEAPQHKVILTQPIYFGIHEVTQAEYEKVMGTNPSHFAPNGTGQEAVAGMDTSNHPIEKVSWNDAAEFCAKLSQLEKFKPSSLRAGAAITPLDGTGYRLPSEAEWEFACRAGTTTKYWIGDKDEDLERAGWFGANSGDRTHAAGELKANPFGLFDIHGNVWEWVQDGWSPSSYGGFQQNPAINPSSPSSSDTERVVRGGRWYHSASYCRSSTRLSVAPTDRFEDLGFRASLSVDAVKEAIVSSNTVASATATALAKRRFASDEWIDVIPLIDPQADKWDVPQRTGKNAWRIERGELVVGGDTLASKLVLPLDSDWPAFECELEFTRRVGDSGFNVNLPTKVGECPLLFDPTGTSGAFLGSRTKGVQLKAGAQLVTGQRATIRVEVRRQQDADHVSVAFNGAAIGEWTGDRAAISYSYREGFPHDRRVSLWIHPGGNEFVFHRIRVRMLDGGTAETLRPIPIAAPSTATPSSIAPFVEADIKRIAALSAADQIEEIRKELMKRNPGFDGKAEHKIENGVVTELQLITDEIIDISPVRALQGLVSLNLSATPLPGRRGKLSDISPLGGLPLTHLDLCCTEVTNIEVVKAMPLKHLSLDRAPVTDLSPLTGKVLKSLHFGGTKVKSLSEVPIASSEVIHCHLLQISDKAELQRLGVRFLDLWGVPATVDPERLRALKPPLSRVNGKPLEEFLKDIEAAVAPTVHDT